MEWNGFSVLKIRCAFPRGVAAGFFFEIQIEVRTLTRMRKILTVALVLGVKSIWAQFGVAFHQSNLPFVGVHYEWKDRFRPELRIGVDQYTDNLSFEGAGFFDVIDKTDFEFYAGLGFRTRDFSGLVLPVGLNVYPFPVKNFGLHMELATLFSEENWLLRGSWGIRYRFRKSDAP